MTYVLILGNSQDQHARHLYQQLTSRGIIAKYWNSRLFPSQLKIIWQPDEKTASLVFADGEILPLSAINRIFWRTFYPVQIPPLSDSAQKNIAYHDAMGLLRSFMQLEQDKWVNSWYAYQLHQEKPLQLRQVADLGVTIPPTMITNNAGAIAQFYQEHQSVIFKPVYGGAHTQFLTEEYLAPERMNLALSIAPVTIQKYIPGTNIRSYVIGDQVYAGEIKSEAVDFREDQDHQLIPIKLPADIKNQCLAITKKLGMQWTGIDWRLTPTGEYFFLEANFSPMFIYFEQQTGLPITDSLIELLTNSRGNS